MYQKPAWWGLGLLALLVLTGTLVTAKTLPTAQLRAVDGGTVFPMQGFTISGTVRDTGGNPIAEAQVIGFGDHTTVTAQTNAQGVYALSVSADNYDVQAYKVGFFAGHIFGLTVPPSHSAVDIVLPVTNDFITFTPTSTATGTATATTTGTATATATSTVTGTAPPLSAYLPLVIKVLPPIATPTSIPSATATPGGTPTPVSQTGLHVRVNTARQVAQVTCQQGLDRTTHTPKPGFALIIVDVRVQNAQTATISSTTIGVIDNAGMRWDVFAPEFSGSYCPSTFVSTYPPGDYVESFAFIVSESSLAQPFTLRFANADPASFTVQHLVEVQR